MMPCDTVASRRVFIFVNEVAAPRFAIAIEFRAIGSHQDQSALIVCCDRAQSLGVDWGVQLSIALLAARERDKHGGAADWLYMVLYALEDLRFLDDHFYAFSVV